ncbi:hypothetical protein [Natronorubrum halophilum]|nr:hypothetical protein [Natronorubrum halophilum]
MNRRNVLVGLGTIVAGGGAALGTGAFSSVEADRSVTLETTGDASALLQFSATSSVASTDGGSGDGQLEFDETTLNEDAVTTFDPAFTVENTGGEDVGFYVKEDGTNIASDGIIDFIDEDGNSIVQADHEGGSQIDLPASAPGPVDVGIVVDTDDSNSVGDIDTVTLVASTEAHGQ